MTLKTCRNCWHCVTVVGTKHCRRWNRSLSERELNRAHNRDCWVDNENPPKHSSDVSIDYWKSLGFEVVGEIKEEEKAEEWFRT